VGSPHEGRACDIIWLEFGLPMGKTPLWKMTGGVIKGTEVGFALIEGRAMLPQPGKLAPRGKGLARGLIA